MSGFETARDKAWALEKESRWARERDTGGGEWEEIGKELEQMINQSLNASQGTSAIIFHFT